MSACEFAELDGAYVLGALSPAERQDFEQHLATCEDCARSVRELAGLPGLLVARRPGRARDPRRPSSRCPTTLLPSLVREVRRTRERRRFTTVGLAAAAAVAVGAIVVRAASAPAQTPVASPLLQHEPERQPADPVGETMMPVGARPGHRPRSPSPRSGGAPSST